MSQAGFEIRRLRSSSLARNTVWMLAGQGTNVILRAAYFILLARLLGVSEYGVFVGAFALVGLATPYCGLGSGLLFMRYVGADRNNCAAYWGNIVLATLGGGLLVSFVLYLGAPHLLNSASASVIVPVALGECIFQQFVLCAGQMFQAFERLHMTALAGTLTGSLRLTAVAVMTLLMHSATAWQWAFWSLIVSAVAAAVAVIVVVASLGLPRFSLRLLASRFGEGFNFAIAGSTQSVYNDIDKTMLSHYGMNIANGIYTMAYRIVDIATIPILALDSAALPRFFRKSAQSADAVVSLSTRLARRAAILGVVMAAGMFFAAPLIPRIVGSGFRQSVLALRWLCLIPVFRGAHHLTGSAITGTGFQRYRTAAQFVAAALNFGLNLWLIPRYGWEGAAWASLATDGSLGVANWVIARGIPTHVARRSTDAA
jgi:O-antigen/teichoic acid export membrane protein